MDDAMGVDINDFNGAPNQTGPPALNAGEVDQIRDVLTSLPGLENTLQALQREQTLLTESVAPFATRMEHRHHENVAIIGRNQELLEQVIQQMQSFTAQSAATMTSHTEQFSSMRGEMEQLRGVVQTQQQELIDLRANVATGHLNFTPSNPTANNTNQELYPEWDVTGNMPPNTPEYTPDELEYRIAQCLKQKETPIFSGDETDDLDVYVLNMISWYGAFGLFLKKTQVDQRVGQLMMNHTKGKAKAWFLQEYRGELRWSCIAKKLRQRFLTKSREEDRVAQLFDCSQGSRPLDNYIDEFLRLARTDEVSPKFKMILFKKGLRSQELRNFLQTKICGTLEELVDTARSMNPGDPPRDGSKNTEKKATSTHSTSGGRKSSAGNAEKRPESTRCSSTHCMEIGHPKEKCWQLHPELQPKWMKSKKNNAVSTDDQTVSTSGNDQLIQILMSLQSDMAKLKADLN